MYPLQLKTYLLSGQPVSLYVPDIEAVQQAFHTTQTTAPLAPFPYWAQVWPAALALGTFLLQQPHYVHQKKVLELAAGLGLPSVIAARYAKHVVCTDYMQDAVAVAQQSAQHLGILNMECSVLDWHHLPVTLQTDVLLLSDVNYEPQQFEALHKLLNQFLERGTTIILSTPQRLMAKTFIQRLMPWCPYQQQIEVPQQAQNVPVTIMVLKGK